jgi:hypothetical protein
MHDQNFGEGIKFLEASTVERRQAVYKCAQTLLQGLVDEAIELGEKENLLKSLEHLGIAEIKNLIAQEPNSNPNCKVIPFRSTRSQHRSAQTIGTGSFHQNNKEELP